MRQKGFPSRAAYNAAARRTFELRRTVKSLVAAGASDAAIAEATRLEYAANAEWSRALRIFNKLEAPFRAIRNAEWAAENAKRWCETCSGDKTATCHAHAKVGA